MASHPFRTNPVSGKSLSARPAPKGREPGPGAASRTSRLAGGEFHQLDGVRIDNRPAHPLGCIEMHEGLVAERIPKDARLAALRDQVTGAELAKRDIGSAPCRDTMSLHQSTSVPP